MNDPVLTVLRATLATVTDLGRGGHSYFGIPANGAADQYSATVANILAGNRADFPIIEVTATEFSFTTTKAILVSVTGADCRVAVDGHSCQTWQPICVRAGQTVTVKGIHHGLRAYVAVNGRMVVPYLLGSCAPDRLLKNGTALRTGSRLELHTDYSEIDHPIFRIPLIQISVTPPRMYSPWNIEVTDGPDLAEFPDARSVLEENEYAVDASSDAIGLRLNGVCPTRTSTAELLSKGVPIGAIEVPPAGGLLALLRGRPVTAGYPVVAVATRLAQDRLGQARPGDTIRFVWTTEQAALAAYRSRMRQLHRVAARVRTAFDALKIPQ